MIFILLGTQDSPFPRILKETEEAANVLNLTEDIYAQAGTTNYSSDRLVVNDYFLGQEYSQLIKDARLIITHGGAGILFKCIHLGKKIICQPRLADLGEHNDNHQLELVEKLAQAGYIYQAKGSILEAMKEIDSFTPAVYQNQNTIAQEIQSFIDSI